MTTKFNKKHSKRHESTTVLSPQQMKESNSKSQKDFLSQCKLYWESKPYIKESVMKNTEMEIRFGTLPGSERIQRTDFDNIVKRLYSLGFTTTVTEGDYLLKMQSEYLDPERKGYSLSNIRVEIKGIVAIQEYCKNNDLLKLIESDTYRGSVSIYKKDKYVSSSGDRLGYVDFKDFNFRSTLDTEEYFNIVNRHGIVKSIVENWNKNKKTYRYINRITFQHDEYPVKMDLSIVKSSRRNGKDFERNYSTSESGVFLNKEQYEVEIEINNEKLGPDTNTTTLESLVSKVRKCIKFVMMGIQESNYPISISERHRITQEYLKLIKSKHENTRLFPNEFIGPSSYTLQIKNIVEKHEDTMQVPNIRDNYTVTDKADGERRIMFISKNGHIYLLNTNMKFIFTGSKTNNDQIFNTLLDGELISHDKTGNFINLFAAFDIYILNKEDIRRYRFNKPDSSEKDELKRRSRLVELNTVIKSMNVLSVTQEKSKSPLRVNAKTFYAGNAQKSIFTGCSTILNRIEDGLFEYNTDGLIFTPGEIGVGGDPLTDSEVGPLKKITWKYSFKWKPSEFNTIDFMVTTKKSDDGKEIVKTVFETGDNNASIAQYTNYKVVVLRVGFDEEQHGFINPFQDVIDDNIFSGKEDKKDVEKGYRPMQFIPTDPYDKDAGICHLKLLPDSDNVPQMYTEENEVIEDNSIVEFRYELTNEKDYKWVPLRVRYDKTTELRRGLNNFGNSYHVANNNWHSIHNPITEAMITTGRDIPLPTRDDDVYYDKVTKRSYTRSLRNFHNRFVKYRLITGVSKPGDILIDVACGKAGDLSKWVDSKLKFVFGIDLSPDNIENRLDGACARYIEERRENTSAPGALFVTGNTAYNIRSGQAIKTEKEKQITSAIFGNIPKNKKLGKAVEKYHGVGEDGFNVTSCQFALHYFFKDEHMLHRFIRNISECTAVGGYFIGACYNGKTIFDMLEKKKKGEEVQLHKNNRKIWGVKKLYEKDKFLDDDSSLGYCIDVYQETINQYFPEYLVNFDYLVRVMENYSLVPVSEKEAKDIGLTSGVGSFKDLFDEMSREVRVNPSKKSDYGTALNMSYEEKEISFKNNYFVFKKLSNVNVDRVLSNFKKSSKVEEVIEEESTKSSSTSSETFPGTPEGTPPMIQIERAKEKEKEQKKTKTVRKTNSKNTTDTENPGEIQTIKVKKPRKLNKTITLQGESKE